MCVYIYIYIYKRLTAQYLWPQMSATLTWYSPYAGAPLEVCTAFRAKIIWASCVKTFGFRALRIRVVRAHDRGKIPEGPSLSPHQSCREPSPQPPAPATNKHYLTSDDQIIQEIRISGKAAYRPQLAAGASSYQGNPQEIRISGKGCRLLVCSASKIQIAAASPDPQAPRISRYGAFPENSVTQSCSVCRLLVL